MAPDENRIASVLVGVLVDFSNLLSSVSVRYPASNVCDHQSFHFIHLLSVCARPYNSLCSVLLSSFSPMASHSTLFTSFLNPALSPVPPCTVRPNLFFTWSLDSFSVSTSEPHLFVDFTSWNVVFGLSLPGFSSPLCPCSDR